MFNKESKHFLFSRVMMGDEESPMLLMAVGQV